jgi:predicted ATPase
MDLLGRAPLLDELSGALADTAAGGRVVLVPGEAGIGKSTLVRRFTERQAGQARRSLKRHLANVVYSHLITDHRHRTRSC